MPSPRSLRLVRPVGAAGGPAAPTPAPRCLWDPPWRWAAFDPPFRDRNAALSARREVRCRACGSLLGDTDDPLEALLLAWRHRRLPAGGPRRGGRLAAPATERVGERQMEGDGQESDG